MRKKAQTLIISLWILVILAFLAVGIGHRVSVALYLSRYHRDKLKTFSLAKAGLNLATAELNKDTNNYDASNEPWADNEEIFKKIVIDGNEDGFATVSYNIVKDSHEETIFGIVDEERKININTASRELFLALLEECKIDSSQDIVNNILIWRGDIPDTEKIYGALGYRPKQAKFTNIEELRLVKGITLGDYQKLKEIITVYGGSAINVNAVININTVSPEVVTIFARGIAKKLTIAEKFADNLAVKINELKNSKGPFKGKKDITVVPTGSEETNIFNNFINNIVFKSNYFLIEVMGNAGKIKSKVSAVYNRGENKIIYWHES